MTLLIWEERTRLQVPVLMEQNSLILILDQSKWPQRRAFISSFAPVAFQRATHTSLTSFPPCLLYPPTSKMKQSSIIVAALLSCLAVASPDGGACGAQATVTVTQVITSNLGGDSAQGTVTVTLGGNQGPPVAAPSVVTVTQNLGGSAVPSIGGAVDAAIPAISAATSSSIGIAADQSAALPPTVDDSAATTSVDSSSAQTSSSSTSADLDWSFNGSTNNSTTVNSATDDSTTVNSTTDESSADESTTDEFSTDASTTDDPSTDGSTDISQDASSPTTLTKVLTSTINGGPKIITVTSTIKKNVAPTPARLTTITKVFTSVISSANGAVSTVTGEF
jgi:hypothetical protein